MQSITNVLLDKHLTWFWTSKGEISSAKTRNRRGHNNSHDILKSIADTHQIAQQQVVDPINDGSTSTGMIHAGLKI